jgi:hypothetical protein
MPIKPRGLLRIAKNFCSAMVASYIPGLDIVTRDPSRGIKEATLLAERIVRTRKLESIKQTNTHDATPQELSSVQKYF